MMNAEDKLFKNVDRLMLHDSLKKNEVLTVWERTFLSSVYSIYRRTSGNKYSTKGLSPKQKNAALSILKKHGYHLND